jgi:hypothetical protein
MPGARFDAATRAKAVRLVREHGDASYLACEANPKRDKTKPWFDQHPRSIWVREDALQRLVHEFFASRIFGPERQAHLAAALADQHQENPAETTKRRDHLQNQIVTLLDRLPQLAVRLESAPEPLGRDLYEAFQLTVTVTVTEDSLDFTGVAAELTRDCGRRRVRRCRP